LATNCSNAYKKKQRPNDGYSNEGQLERPGSEPTVCISVLVSKCNDCTFALNSRLKHASHIDEAEETVEDELLLPPLIDITKLQN
jgi:ribosomal protein L44E